MVVGLLAFDRRPRGARFMSLEPDLSVMSASLAHRLRLPVTGSILVLNAPGEFRNTLGDPPVEVHDTPRGIYAFVLAFVLDRAAAAAVLPAALGAFDGEGMLWVAYPKKSSHRYASDLDRDLAASLLGPFGTSPWLRSRLTTTGPLSGFAGLAVFLI